MEYIFKTIVGSHLYGLATADSDKDYKGIFMADRHEAIPSEDQILGVMPFKERNRIEMKEGEGADKIEGTFYSGKYFIELFMKGNPTITEIPFCDGDYVEEKNEFGLEITKFVRENMITRHLIGGYLGYYNSQVSCFKNGTGRNREKRLKDRFNQIDAGMYDGKMASHAYRIGVQGIDLFTQGHVVPTLQGEQLEIAQTLKKEKFDVIPRDEMIKLISDVGEKLEEACKKSTLPNNFDLVTVSNFIVDFQKRYYSL